MKTLTVTDEAVKRAAEKCPTAKEVLTELFPDVFKKPPLVFSLKGTMAGFEEELDFLPNELLSASRKNSIDLAHEIISFLMKKYLPGREYIIRH